jgi:RNA polymerase sigma-70 factor (ECF subfamily)
LPIDVDEINLINAAKKDPMEFGKLYEIYITRIYNYIYFRVGDAHDAEDITARVFFRALKSISSYKHMGLPFSAWLYRIAHNLVANHHRDHSRLKEISLESIPDPILPQKHEFPEVTLQKKDEANLLLALISDLPSVRQELISLKFMDNLSNAEIGKILRKSEGAVKSLYHRTLLELREKIKEELPDLEEDQYNLDL